MTDDKLPVEVELHNLKIRYGKLKAKSERQRKQIAMLERSRASMRAFMKTLRKNWDTPEENEAWKDL